MSLLVSDLITRARAILRDGNANNFTQDDISDLANGSATVFRAFNQNILTTPAAPAAPVVRINNVSSAISSFNPQTGLITLGSAPAQGTIVYLEYWFVLMVDAEYIGFAQGASSFLGLAPAFTLTTDDSKLSGDLAEAAIHYMAFLGAKAMTNLSSWYYNTSAGNKTIDKAEIAKAFGDMAKDEYKTAVLVRDDFYKREGARNAPAWGRGHTPFPSYTPPR